MIRRCLIAWACVACVLAQDAHADRAEARVLVNAGQSLARAGDLAGALGRYERAIKQAGDYLPAYEAAIPLWIGAKRFRDLRRHLERVTLRHPNHATAWYALAYAYRRLGRPRLAIAAYQIYMPLRPHEASAWFGMAMSHKQLGDDAKALDAFRRYLKRERDPLRKAFVAQARREIDELVRWRGVAGPAMRFRRDGAWLAGAFMARPLAATLAVGVRHADAVMSWLATPPPPEARPAATGSPPAKTP